MKYLGVLTFRFVFKAELGNNINQERNEILRELWEAAGR